MRQLLYTAISRECRIIAKECGETDGSVRVFERSALGVADVPAVPDKPFVLIAEMPSAAFQEVRETSRAELRMFQVWAYDELGDYTRIETLLWGVRETVLGLPGRESPSGARCTDVKWTGNSQDLVDPTLNDSAAKWASFQFVTSQREA